MLLDLQDQFCAIFSFDFKCFIYAGKFVPGFFKTYINYRADYLYYFSGHFRH